MTDCPRFTERHDWIELANGNWGGAPQPSEEAVTYYGVAGDGSWSQQTTPDGTIYKEFYYTSGWQTGLASGTEVWSGGVKQKWTTTGWTQDNVNAGYPINPRPTETNIYDAAGNRRRTTISYYTFTLPGGGSCSLPNQVFEYAGDGVTLLRRTTTDYDLNANYLNRRLVGLVNQTQVFDGSGALFAKTIYMYDANWGGYYMQPTAAAPVQHDETNFPSSFVEGRGNLVWVGRFDVNDPDNWNKYIATVVGYNQTGQATFAQDAGGHRTSFVYNDNWTDGSNHNTFAYPTQAQDAEGNWSYTQYNYDFGAPTRVTTPSPNAGQTAPYLTYTYDAAARLTRITNGVNGAYTRWEYSTNGRDTYSAATIQEGAGEIDKVTGGDGAGRALATVDALPSGTGVFRVQWQAYDKMGRLVQQTNPTETDANWNPVAEDTGAWAWTFQSYDFKGRPLQTTNPDGTTKVISYGGCGCAGGEVTTIQDEHGRQRRLTKDTQGRLSQVEELNWNTSVYAYTNYYYNARDQLVNSNQAGQWRGFAYDGYGRLLARDTPEQGHTTYSYNADDTINVVTDARGATTTFGYNPRHLVTGITYGVPGGVAATPNVSFGYDAAGNRASMTDGMGTVTYGYNQLSRLTSETRNFNGVGSYTLSYAYNLAGELTSITNPWGAQVSYGYDKAGRVTNVGGSGYAGVSSYASALTYRAFGATKGMSYGDGKTLTTAYDKRLRPTTWNVAGVLGYNYNYDYFNEHTGRVSYAQNIQDATLDRSYEYDQAGRLAISHAGAEARAHAYSGQWGTMDGPYSQGYDYDVWGNVTHKYGWGGEVQGGGAGQSSDIYYNYTGNRRNGFSYDAAGNLTNDIGQTFTYDATGQQATAAYGGYLLQQVYDGDGLRVKKNDNGAQTYYLRSSVLGGQVVAEIIWASVSWQWSRGYVYLGSQLLAVQQGGVSWMHEDPITKSKRVTDAAGTVVSTIELDPWGADTNRSSNAAFQPKKFTSYDRDANGSDEAMFRRYNRKHSRFDQPDPYDGSYSLTNPQSLNRYAYVQNDPVNFVDPSGLNLEAPGDGYCIRYHYSNPATGEGFWGGWVCYGGGGGGGGGTGGGNTGGEHHNAHAQKQSDCRKTVDDLVNRQRYRQLSGQATAVTAGRGMAWDAVNGRFRKGHDDPSLGTSGFQEGLVANRQGADVYKHIYGVAGGTLIGDRYVGFPGLPGRAGMTGTEAVNAQINQDREQALGGRLESYAELADDYAGTQVGLLMLDRINGKTSNLQLSDALFRLLCSH